MFGEIQFTWEFVSAFLGIVLIDLVLAGDNAVVIAMAVRSLPRKKRILGIVVGSGGAVLLRVACTFVVAQLLLIPYVKLAGGAVILWIALKLMLEGGDEAGGHRESRGLIQALWIIMLADISMSVDNMLAVAAASHGNLFLLLVGLGLSIPFVVFTSNLLATLMDRFPIIVYIGAAVLGRVGGEMMITDPWVQERIHPSHLAEYSVQAFCAVGIIASGLLLLRLRSLRERARGAAATPARPAED